MHLLGCYKVEILAPVLSHKVWLLWLLFFIVLSLLLLFSASPLVLPVL